MVNATVSKLHMFEGAFALSSSEPTDGSKRFGARIAAARLAMGLSQEEAAEKLNVTASHVSHIESGNRNPSRRLLRRLAELYGEDEVYLMSGMRPAPPEPDAVLDYIVRLAASLDAPGRRGLAEMVRAFTRTYRGRSQEETEADRQKPETGAGTA